MREFFFGVFDFFPVFIACLGPYLPTGRPKACHAGQSNSDSRESQRVLPVKAGLRVG